MFVFGHIGIGYRLVKPWSQNLLLKYILLGTLLPDLIDKPLYYLGVGGLITGTRTFGHTLIFLLLLGAVSLHRTSCIARSMWTGTLTHFLLDYFTDFFRSSGAYIPDADPMYALLFPLLGFRFPMSPFNDAGEHMNTLLFNPFILLTEGLGLWVILTEGWFRIKVWRHK